jgi:hypothetical protein
MYPNVLNRPLSNPRESRGILTDPRDPDPRNHQIEVRVAHHGAQ